MRQFVAYVRKTLHLGALTKATLRHSRRRPQIGGDLCFLLTVLMIVQRYPSFHSFEEGFEGLDTCPYPLRVIKALYIKGPANLKLKPKDWQSKNVHTWWLAAGAPKSRLTGPQAFDILRCRWDIENNAYNDLTQNWNFKHSYLHHENGLQIMMYAFMIAYNLFELFLYRCLRNFDRSGATAVSIAKQMKRDLSTITDPGDGFDPIDSS